MSGGLTAQDGFDYQSTVALELLLEALAAHPETTMRPEGADDVVLSVPTRSPTVEHVQVKKPRTDKTGARQPSNWTMSQVAAELLPGAVARLAGNDSRQLFVLGDQVDTNAGDFFWAAADAPIETESSYLHALHALAKPGLGDVGKTTATKLTAQVKKAATTGDPAENIERWIETIRGLLTTLPPSRIDEYVTQLRSAHGSLPNVLSRTQVVSSYGEQLDVRQRVVAKLQALGLPQEVASSTLFRNLRAYISDVARQHGRWIDREDLELELRTVWPTMVPVRLPPSAPTHHIQRDYLIEHLWDRLETSHLSIQAVSGSGKTSVASRLASTDDEARRLYVEVESDTSIRNVLVGIGYVLRRYGHEQLFGAIVHGEMGTEDVVRESAKILHHHPERLVLLLDFVDGSCSDVFAAHLARLFREIGGGSTRLVTFSKDDCLRSLTATEKATLALEYFTLPGFSFDEFKLLVSKVGHEDLEHDEAHEIYQGLTHGQSSGLLPALASSVANLPSSNEMIQVANSRPQDMLMEAERRRFQTIPTRCREAAERIICIPLSFDVAELAMAFPSDPVREAVLELKQRGLLIQHEAETYSVHSLVRRGLEALLPPAETTRMHKELANWYGAHGNTLAQIHHLSCASEQDEADRLALAMFKSGQSRRAVIQYIAERNLVSADEAVDMLFDKTFEDSWILRYLITSTKSAATILSRISAAPGRFDSDFQFALHACEIAFRAHEGSLDSFFDFARLKNTQERLRPIALAMHRLKLGASFHIRQTFNSASIPTKRLLLPTMVARLDKTSLGAALRFVDEDQHQTDATGNPKVPTLRIQTSADVDAFVAALPVRPLREFIVARGPLLGPLASIPLAQPEIFGPRCRELAMEPTSSDEVRLNALRIMTLLGDAFVLDAHKHLPTNTGAYSFSVLAPAILGRRDLLPAYEDLLLDSSADRDHRMAALMAVSLLGGDLDRLMSEVLSAAGNERDGWEFLFLLQSTNRPFEGMVPALERYLQQGGQPTLAVPMLSGLGQLRSPASRKLLLSCLAHRDHAIRLAASQALHERRDCDFREVIQSAHSEKDAQLRQAKIVTALCMAPPSASAFGDLWSKTPNAKPWHAVAVGRTRDFSELPRLVVLASDPNEHWQTRSASIKALSLFLYRDGLQKVAGPIMDEHSTLVEDNEFLVGHEVLSSICTNFAPDLLQAHAHGRAQFERTVGVLVEVAGESRMWNSGMTSAKTASRWLWQSITGAADPALGIDEAVNRLHVPLLQSAVLAGLGRRGQKQVLEDLLRREALSTWLALRVVHWLVVLAKGDGPARRRLEELVAQRHDRARLSNMLGRRRRPSAPRPAPPPEKEIAQALTRDDVKAALYSGRLPPGSLTVCLGPDEWKAMALELSPTNDRRTVLDSSSIALPQLSAGRSLNLGQRVLTTIDNHSGVRAKLRPLFAAAAPPGVVIPWLKEQLHRKKFTKQYASAIAKLGKCAFERAVERSGHDLLLALSTYSVAKPLFSLSGSFLLPALERCVSSGNDAFFEVLCRFATNIDDGESETVLSHLMHRWHGQLMRQRGKAAVQVSPNLSKGFRSLSECPRTRRIPNYARLLLEVSTLPLGIHRDTILRLLGSYPSAYSRLESINWRDTPFYVVGNLELDDVCDELFRLNVSA